MSRHGRPDLLIIGAGFTGLTLAKEAVTKDSSIQVHVIDRRPHIGGNAYTHVDPATQILVHDYGTHIFHTASDKVGLYLRPHLAASSGLNTYRHQVISQLETGQIVPLPLSLATINAIRSYHPLYHRDEPLQPHQLRHWIAEDTKTNHFAYLDPEESAEAKAISLVGPTVYHAVIEGYTQKQWGHHPSQLPADIIARLPIRNTYDSNYFPATHRFWQGVPRAGYTPVFEDMADHPRIHVTLGVDHLSPSAGPYSRDRVYHQIPAIFTGPIDRYFNFRHGALEWRTVDFTTKTVAAPDTGGNVLGAAVINFASPAIPFTRVHEFRHLHPERESAPHATPATPTAVGPTTMPAHSPTHSVLAYETSRATSTLDVDDLPYYPVRTTANMRLLARYRQDARQLMESPTPVIFAGRLGRFQYLDMDMAVASALSLSDRLWGPATPPGAAPREGQADEPPAESDGATSTDTGLHHVRPLPPAPRERTLDPRPDYRSTPTLVG